MQWIVTLNRITAPKSSTDLYVLTVMGVPQDHRATCSSGPGAESDEGPSCRETTSTGQQNRKHGSDDKLKRSPDDPPQAMAWRFNYWLSFYPQAALVKRDAVLAVLPLCVAITSLIKLPRAKALSNGQLT